MSATSSFRIPLAPAAWAMSAALVVVFVLCAALELVAPNLPFAHDWIDLFTVRPVTSAFGWIEGIVGSVAVAWIFAVVGGIVFNKLSAN